MGCCSPTPIAKAAKLLFPLGAVIAILGFIFPIALWSLGFDLEMDTVSIDSFACGDYIRDNPSDLASCEQTFFATCKETGIDIGEGPLSCMGSFHEGGVMGFLENFGSEKFWNSLRKWLPNGQIAKPNIGLPG